jgi:hypothetical protein
MFLPLTLRDRIGDVQVPDEAGGSTSLVTEERLLLASDRQEPPVSPPLALPVFLVVGFLWGGGFLWLVGGGSGLGAWRRLGVLMLGGGWSLLAALSGSLLLGAWAFTDHVFWYANYNLFQVNPVFFPLPAAFLLLVFRNRFPGWGRTLAVSLGILALVGMAMELVPGLGQKNAEILALTLPVNLALWIGAVRLRRGGTGARVAEEREAG